MSFIGRIFGSKDPAAASSVAVPSAAELEHQYQDIMRRFRGKAGGADSLRICLMNNNQGRFDDEVAWFRKHPTYAVQACKEALESWPIAPETQHWLRQAVDLYSQRSQEQAWRASGRCVVCGKKVRAKDRRRGEIHCEEHLRILQQLLKGQ